MHLSLTAAGNLMDHLNAVIHVYTAVFLSLHPPVSLSLSLSLLLSPYVPLHLYFSLCPFLPFFLRLSPSVSLVRTVSLFLSLSPPPLGDLNMSQDDGLKHIALTPAASLFTNSHPEQNADLLKCMLFKSRMHTTHTQTCTLTHTHSYTHTLT